MSRGLSRTSCQLCGFEPMKLEEAPRPITEVEAGHAYGIFACMLIAKAHCTICKTRYLAWVDGRPTGREQLEKYARPPLEYFDLSFRSTFNDEPGTEDTDFEVKRSDPTSNVIRIPKHDDGEQIVLLTSYEVVTLKPKSMGMCEWCNTSVILERNPIIGYVMVPHKNPNTNYLCNGTGHAAAYGIPLK